MLLDLVSNPGPLTYESGAPPIALRGPAEILLKRTSNRKSSIHPSISRTPFLSSVGSLLFTLSW